MSLRLLAIPWSTNVERVMLALGHKGIDAELVPCDPRDRSPQPTPAGRWMTKALIWRLEFVAEWLAPLPGIYRVFIAPSSGSG